MPIEFSTNVFSDTSSEYGERRSKFKKDLGSFRYSRLSILLLSAFVATGCGSSGGDSEEDTATMGQNTNGEGTNGEGTNDENTNGGDTNGGNNGTPPEGDFPAFQGLFILDEQTIDDVRTLSLNASFIESNTRVFQGHQFLLGLDRCQESLGGTGSLPPEAISAGEVLVLSNPDGTLAQVEEQVDDLTRNYMLDVAPITEAQTVGMTLDIPGDQYPELSTLVVQELDAISGIDPLLDSEVNAQSVYRWQPSIHPDTIINLNINGFLVSGIGSVSLVCSLIDDGEFSLTDHGDEGVFFQNFIGDSTTTSWSMSRSRYVDHFENGAYLEISRTVHTE